MESGNCTTPHSKKGNCISLYDCPSLMALNRNYANLDDTQRSHLNQSQCDGLSALSVCCSDIEPFPKDNENNLLPPRTECGRHINQQKLQDIVDGQTDVNQYPWMAIIELKNHKNISSYNGYGVLISDCFVYKRFLALFAIKRSMRG